MKPSYILSTYIRYRILDHQGVCPFMNPFRCVLILIVVFYTRSNKYVVLYIITSVLLILIIYLKGCKYTTLCNIVMLLTFWWYRFSYLFCTLLIQLDFLDLCFLTYSILRWMYLNFSLFFSGNLHSYHQWKHPLPSSIDSWHFPLFPLNIP